MHYSNFINHVKQKQCISEESNVLFLFFYRLFFQFLFLFDFYFFSVVLLSTHLNLVLQHFILGQKKSKEPDNSLLVDAGRTDGLLNLRTFESVIFIFVLLFATFTSTCI